MIAVIPALALQSAMASPITNPKLSLALLFAAEAISAVQAPRWHHPSIPKEACNGQPPIHVSVLL
jgi:hypothetical protein